MYKIIFKYFIIYILPVNILFAQGSGLNKDYYSNYLKVNKTEFWGHQNLNNSSFNSGNDKITTTAIVDRVYKMLLSIFKGNQNINNNNSEKPLLDNIFTARASGSADESPGKDIVRSVSDNIEIGGISGKYAVISFNPKFSFAPSDNISISANQNIRYLIPTNSINEHLQLLFIQSAYMLAIDNFMHLMSKTQTLTQSIIGFVAKNLVSSVVNQLIDNNSKNKTFSITSYYYSIKIKL